MKNVGEQHKTYHNSILCIEFILFNCKIQFNQGKTIKKKMQLYCK